VVSVQAYELSILIAWVAAIVPVMLLRRALLDGLRVMQLYKRTMRGPDALDLDTGEKAPKFDASRLDVRDRVRLRDLRGQPATLLFVAPADAGRKEYEQFDLSLHGIWHKAKGRLYVVCSGDADSCRQFVPEHACDHRDPPVKTAVLWDHDGSIAKRYRVGATPMAVRLDHKGRVASIGRRMVNVDGRGEEVSDVRQD
jgi:peroxiredoxin